MSQEKQESINLMRLNAYYKDGKHANKKLTFLTSCREKFEEFRDIFAKKSPLEKKSLKKMLIQLWYFANQRSIVDKKSIYSFDHTSDINYSIAGEYKEHSIAVYTAIYGGYDSLAEPLFVSQYCDYYVFTDQEVPSDSVWKKVDTSGICEFEKLDNYHKAKFCKVFPNKLFPNYNYSVWVDGNVQIVGDLMPLVDKMSGSSMAAFENPKHNCVYTEAKYNIYHNSVNTYQMKKQIKCYKDDGLPTQFGMREFSIIVREHNNKNIHLMNQWWEQLNKYTMRDQISFPYVLWKNGLSIDYIAALGNNWRWNPRFIVIPHNHHVYFSK